MQLCLIMQLLPTRILNTARSQAERLQDAPEPQQALADSRSLADLLAFAADYGTLIHFYDLQDQTDGDWSVFFKHDPAIVAALLAGLDLAEIKTEFNNILATLTGLHDPKQRYQTALRILRACLRLNNLLGNNASNNAVLNSDLWALLTHPQASYSPQNLHHLAQSLSDEILDFVPHHRHESWFAPFCEALQDLVTELLERLEDRSANARTTLAEALEANLHAPQVALYNAFVMLFAQPQATMNRFSQRLLNFYDETILRQSNRTARADQTFINFTTAKDIEEASVPRGTYFPAGVDANGAAIQYMATRALNVRASTLQHIRILRQIHAPLTADTPPVATRLLTADSLILPDSPVFEKPFPMFGAAQSGPADGVVMQPALLGFGFFGAIFALASGTRHIELILTPTPETIQALTVLLEPVSLQTGQNATFLLAQTIEKSFTLSITTALGLVSGMAFSATATSTSEILLSITLPSEFVGIEAAPDTDAPGVLFQLSQDDIDIGPVNAMSRIAPYSLLKQVMLAYTTITVTVEGLKPATLTSSSGSLDTSQNFPLFGLSPRLGSTVTLTTPELFLKPLSNLSVRIGWADLPITQDGFAGYYKAYMIDADGKTAPAPLFTNASFQVELSVQTPGLWTLPPMTLALFGAATPEIPVPVFSTLHAPTPVISPQADPISANALTMTLTAPSYAFGNMLYNANMMSATLAQSSSTSSCTQLCLQRFGSTTTNAANTLDQLAKLNASASETTYGKQMQTATTQALGTLTGSALAAVHAAIAQSGANANVQAKWKTHLQAHLSKSDMGILASGWRWLVYCFKTEATPMVNKVTVILDEEADAPRESPEARAMLKAVMPEAEATSTADTPQIPIMLNELLHGEKPDLNPALLSTARKELETYFAQALIKFITGLLAAGWRRLTGRLTLTPQMVVTPDSIFTPEPGSTSTPKTDDTPPPAPILPKPEDASLPTQATMPKVKSLEGRKDKAAKIMQRLSLWLETYKTEIGTSTAAARQIALAETILKQGHALAATRALIAKQPAVIARPQLSAMLNGGQASLAATATERLQDCIAHCRQTATSIPLPNQPWTPMVASLDLGYSATITLPAATNHNPMAILSHSLPFGGRATINWPRESGVSLLAPSTEHAAFYLGLSAPVEDITLLFITSSSGDTGPAPSVMWESCATSDQQTGLWEPATLWQDSTEALQNTGIIHLKLAQNSIWLRAHVTQDADHFPALMGVVPNALAARWVGPGGATNLGIPLPAKTITSTLPAIPTLGKIIQPMPAFGGRPEATGQAFALWMAERRRHKNFAIQPWDYASLVLADFPAIWQVDVSEADAAPNKVAPGTVWLTIVPGPTTPGLTDPTTPMADPATLANIKEMLSSRISPFVSLNVTNAPFLRLCVNAELEFDAGDTPEAWAIKLNAELIAWLSPWPDATLPDRPQAYYTPAMVASFIRTRPYVRALLHFSMQPQGKVPDVAYVTSAHQHHIRGVNFADLVGETSA